MVKDAKVQYETAAQAGEHIDLKEVLEILRLLKGHGVNLI
jgi:hypothetical protein